MRAGVLWLFNSGPRNPAGAENFGAAVVLFSLRLGIFA